jgi:hypothetical protein
MEDSVNQKDSASTTTVLAWTLVVVLTILLLISISVIYFVYTEKSSGTASIPQTNTQKIPFSGTTETIPSPSPSANLVNLNKKYTFPIYDSASAKVGEILFVIKDVERTKEITVGNQKATTVGDRDLIVLNIELTSTQNLAAMVNTRNYVRLKVNGEDKLIAPEFHGDPVDLQPQSSKDTRVAFSISEKDADVVLQIGELEGKKDLIKIF